LTAIPEVRGKEAGRGSFQGKGERERSVDEVLVWARDEERLKRMLAKESELTGGGGLRGGAKSRERAEEVYTKTRRRTIPWWREMRGEVM